MKQEIYNELLSIVGSKNISASKTDRICYSKDLLPLAMIWIRQGKISNLPDAIVWPESAEQISKILRVANRERIPVIPWSGGAGVAGGTVPLSGGIVIDMKKMDKVIEINDKALTVRVQTGVIGQDLEMELNSHGYTLGHFPSSMYCSALGGFIVTRSSGQFSSKYGSIEDILIALEVVLPTGEVVRTKAVPRSATGPNLNELFMGSEGRFGIVTEATLRIHMLPETRLFRGIVFQNVHSGLEGIRKIMRTGILPSVVRLYDEHDTSIAMKELGLSAKGCLLVIGFEGRREVAEAEEKVALGICMEGGGKDLGREPGEHWWKHRYDISYKQAEVIQRGGIVDTIEVAANWDKLETLYANMKKAMEKEGAIVLAHFSHVYTEGSSIYFTFIGGGKGDEQVASLYERVWDAAMKACIESGGTISHHHGIGMLKAKWMEAEHGNAVRIYEGIAKLLDPNGIMNPGKLLKK
jgi:alkyldihydroxyacetonephosphate synthase